MAGAASSPGAEELRARARDAVAASPSPVRGRVTDARPWLLLDEVDGGDEGGVRRPGVVGGAGWLGEVLDGEVTIPGDAIAAATDLLAAGTGWARYVLREMALDGTPLESAWVGGWEPLS